jgi:hypothetical protein
MTSQKVTQQQNPVTKQGDTSRARLSYGEDVTVSPVTLQGDTRKGDSDRTPLRASRHHHPQPSHAKTPMTWLHVAALNLIADHEAGIAVSPAKLAAARQLLGRPA